MNKSSYFDYLEAHKDWSEFRERGFAIPSKITMIFTVPLLLVLASTYSTLASPGMLFQCPTEWTAFEGSCYRFFNNPKLTWDSAESHCNTFRLLNSRGHLTSIDSQAENDFLHSWWKTIRGDATQTWIGYSDQDSEGTFLGPEGCPPKFTNWWDGEPNNGGGTHQNCATMWNKDNDLGKWDDDYCINTYGFICKVAL